VVQAAVFGDSFLNGGSVMKATGIVRRIDDLGRVVIPKEIRRTMRIREGDPLEIYTNPEGEVIFKKYSPVGEMSDGAVQAAEVISKLSGAPAVIFDTDHVVAVSGVPKKEYSQRRLSPALEEMLESRKPYAYTSEDIGQVCPVEGLTAHALSVAPIISNGDVSGAVALMATNDSEHVNQNQTMLCQAAAMFLGKQIAF
jgi:AbrB family transcriptional regulator (stage V sporulation protein T)